MLREVGRMDFKVFTEGKVKIIEFYEIYFSVF